MSKHRKDTKRQLVIVFGMVVAALGVTSAMRSPGVEPPARPTQEPRSAADGTAQEHALVRRTADTVARRRAVGSLRTTHAPTETDQGAAGIGANDVASPGSPDAWNMAMAGGGAPDPNVAQDARVQRLVGLFDAAEMSTALLHVDCDARSCRMEIDLKQLGPERPAFEELKATLLRSSPLVSFRDQKAVVVVAAEALDG